MADVPLFVREQHDEDPCLSGVQWDNLEDLDAGCWPGPENKLSLDHAKAEGAV